MSTTRKQTAARWLFALFMIVAGVNHFLAPEIYLGMMPAWLPAKEAANLISGAAGLLIAPLVAVFSVNIHVALHGNMPESDAPPWLLWLRLPFHGYFVTWVCWVGIDREKSP
jgi:uncharacterized membrane protein